MQLAGGAAPQPIYDLLGVQFDRFSDRLGQLIRTCGLDLELFHMDHVALRPTTQLGVIVAERLLGKRSDLVSVREVNGRPISVFHLTEPLHVLGRPVAFVEVLHLKTSPERRGPLSQGELGWDHAEFVFPPGEDLIKTKSGMEAWAKWHYSSLLTNLPAGVESSFGMPSSAADRMANPHWELKVRGGPLLRIHPIAIEHLRANTFIQPRPLQFSLQESLPHGRSS